jgi:hypothetical protein
MIASGSMLLYGQRPEKDLKRLVKNSPEKANRIF